MTEKYVALDIGGVCIKLETEKAMEYFHLHEMPEDGLALFDQMERGKIDEAEFIEKASQLLPHPMSRDEFALGWSMIIGPAMEGMSELVEEFTNRGVKFVFLSDISTFHLREIRKRFPGEKFISNGVYSFEVGAKKPEAPMYATFERNYAKPILYVDDRMVCLNGGQDFNWRTHQFKDAATLRHELENILSE